MFIYSSSINGYSLLVSAAGGQSSARAVIEQMGSDIRVSHSGEVINNGSVLILVGTNATIRFYTENNCLYRRITNSNGTTAIPMADNINSLYFSISDSLVLINLEAAAGENRQTVSTAVNFRI